MLRTRRQSKFSVPKPNPEARLKQLADFDYGFAPPGKLIGIDEVGVASWAGPLVACAIVLKSYRGLEGVDDSKELSLKKREEVYPKIMAQAKEVELAFISVKEVDRLGSDRAAHAAREQAFYALRASEDAKMALIDGGEKQSHSFPIFCKSIKKGDTKSLSIAAASVVAKVLLDRFMVDLAKSYPYYGWHTNMGYGTKVHAEGIRNHGISPYHRLSFDPIRVAVGMEKKEVALVKSFRRRPNARQT